MKSNPFIPVLRSFGAALFGATLYFVAIGGAMAVAFGLTRFAAGTARDWIMLLGFGMGIISGIALNFALAPLILRMSVGDRSSQSPNVALAQECFARAGLTPPIVIFSERTLSAAQVSGFGRGRGWFRPVLTLSRQHLAQLGRLELECVIQHEIAHMALSHLRRRFLRAIAVIAVASLGALIATMGFHLFSVPIIAIPYLAYRYLAKNGRLQELEADAYAIRELGAKPTHLRRALEKLDQVAPRGRLALAKTLGFASHPALSERLASIGQVSADLDSAA